MASRSSAGLAAGGRVPTALHAAPERVVTKGSATSSSVSHRSSPPLLGRERELAALSAGLEDALAGRGRVFTLVGDAGMGKTSLAEWLSDRAAERAAAVLWGRCWEAIDTPPFWPWAQVVRQMVTELGRPDVVDPSGGGRLLPEIPAPTPGQQDGSRLAEFDSLTRFMKDVADRRPLVLMLEDLHAADDSSLLMLQFFGREIRDSRIMVAATYDEAAARRRGTHARILSDIGREGHHISLSGLGERAVAELYEAIAGEEAPPAIAHAVFRASEGNPLFVAEATKMLTAKGDIHRPDYSVGFRVPSGVGDMIRRRLETLSQETGAVLSIASVLGREFEVGVLQRMCDLDVDEVLDLVTEGVDQDVVEEAGALGRYRFSHILIRETLYEDLTAAKRMRLHRRAAEVLEDMYEGNLEARLAELAHHWFKAAQAGDSKKTMEYATRAAQEATAHLAFEEGARLYQRALKAADMAAVAPAVRKDLEALLAAAQAKVGEASAGTAPAAQSEDRFEREGDFWTVTYHGTTSRLKDSKGLRFLAHLLRNPGAEIHVLDLVAQVEGQQRDAATVDRAVPLDSDGLGDAGDVLDPAAKAAYKRRLDELQEEIEEAEAFNDPARAERLQDEKDALIQQLAGAVGLGGRDRKAASVAERARVSVTKTIKDALKKIAENDQALGAHLGSTIRTGTYCSYTPDPRVPAIWQL
ncbi:MAG: AAA family ATPase [Actinomycetota bacterium]|nr:AAA family ATPase [Actinomycetota bacterium]